MAYVKRDTRQKFRRAPRRRVCHFCAKHIEEIDYIKLVTDMKRPFDKEGKEGDRFPRIITERGRILPRRVSGICLKHQRALATAVKRARNMALLPFQDE